MSVYIKGMEMPVDCLSCRVACDKESYMVIGRPPKCPLAEAPDGDLIGRAETIEAVELMEIFLGERKKNAVIRGIHALPSADAVSMEEHVKELNDLASAWKNKFINAEKRTEEIYDETMAKVANECKECKERLRNLRPSAEAVQGWIPCSERLPKEKQEVYVTVYFTEGDTGRAYGYMDGFGKWHLYSAVEGTLNSGYEILAWTPLPRPYRKDGEEE